jgi:hypothetical protein
MTLSRLGVATRTRVFRPQRHETLTATSINIPLPTPDFQKQCLHVEHRDPYDTLKSALWDLHGYNDPRRQIRATGCECRLA